MISFKKSTFVLLIPSLLVLLFIQACGDGSTGYYNIELTPPDPYDTSQAVNDSTTEEGLTIYIIDEGNGRPEKTVETRDQVYARYTGRTEDGEAFDSSYRNGSEDPRLFQNLYPNPITSPSTGQTISPLVDGFRSGMLGMKEGEKRTLIIPPELGYGSSDENPTGNDLQDKTLRFDVELVEIL